MNQLNRRPRQTREAGSVMVLALLVTLLILGVGLTAMYLASSGMKVSGNITRRQEAMSASETGIERALSILNNVGASNWSTLLPGCGASRDDKVTTKLNDANPPNRGAILCDSGVPLQDIPVLESASNSITALGTEGLALQRVVYTVYIRNDDNEAGLRWAGSSPHTAAWETDNDRRVVIRVEGIARDSLSFFAVEAVIVEPPPLNSDPCSYGQAGGCSGGNTNSGVADIS